MPAVRGQRQIQLRGDIRDQEQVERRLSVGWHPRGQHYKVKLSSTQYARSLRGVLHNATIARFAREPLSEILTAW